MNDIVKPPSPPQIKMDRSRDYSTVHGDRGPGDPHRHVHFYQNGLPFNAQGILVIDHPEMTEESPEGEKRRAAAEKLIRRAMKHQAKAEPDDADRADVTDDDGDEDDDNGGIVNLEEWITGRQQYPWAEVGNAIAARYSKRVVSQPEAVVFLVEEKLVPANQVAKRFQKFLQ